jgi:hypothetical protein
VKRAQKFLKKKVRRKAREPENQQAGANLQPKLLAVAVPARVLKNQQGGNQRERSQLLCNFCGLFIVNKKASSC